MSDNIRKKMPGTLISVGIIYTCLCIFSLAVGIYFCVNINNLDDFSAEMIKEVELGLQETLNTTQSLTDVVKTIAGVGTTTVGVLQGIAGIGLFFRKNAFRYYTIGFTIFSLLNCSAKLFGVEPEFFAIAKVIVYIYMLIVLFSKATKDWYTVNK